MQHLQLDRRFDLGTGRNVNDQPIVDEAAIDTANRIVGAGFRKTRRSCAIQQAFGLGANWYAVE
jgi:hypothetical protein